MAAGVAFTLFLVNLILSFRLPEQHATEATRRRERRASLSAGAGVARGGTAVLRSDRYACVAALHGDRDSSHQRRTSMTNNPERAWWRELTGYHWFVFIIASAAWFFDCLDQRLFSLARVDALTELDRSERPERRMCRRSART